MHIRLFVGVILTVVIILPSYPLMGRYEVLNEVKMMMPDTESVLTLPLDYYLYGLNPVSSWWTDEEILSLLFEPLVLWDPYNPYDCQGAVPWLLEELPTCEIIYNDSYGGNVSIYTLRLRKGIMFFDGVEMTVDDLMFTLSFIEWAMPSFATDLIIMLIDYWRVDDYTVKVVLNTTGILVTWSLYSLIVYPKHIYEKAEVWGGTPGKIFPRWDVTPGMVREYKARDPNDPILTGYGAFRLVSWEPQGSTCENANTFILERNPDYFMRAVDENGEILWRWHDLTQNYIRKYGVDAFRGPYLKRIVYKVMPENSDKIQAIMGGELDMIMCYPPTYYYPLPLVEEGYTVVYYPSGRYYYLLINTRRSPLNCPAFRRALAYICDKEKICQDVFGGYAKPVDSAVSPAYGNWSLETPDILCFTDTQRERALAELESINITDMDNDTWLEDPNGNEISIEIETYNYAPYREIIENIAEDIESIGIHVRIDFVSLISHPALDPPPDIYLLSDLGSPLGLLALHSRFFLGSLSGWKNDTYDSTIWRCFYEETNYSEILNYAWKAQLILLYEAPIIPLSEAILLGAYKSYEKFGYDGWIGVFEDLIGAPVVNRWTLMKAAKPKIVYLQEENTGGETILNASSNEEILLVVPRILSYWMYTTILIAVILVIVIYKKWRENRKRDWRRVSRYIGLYYEHP